MITEIAIASKIATIVGGLEVPIISKALIGGAGMLATRELFRTETVKNIIYDIFNIAEYPNLEK